VRSYASRDPAGVGCRVSWPDETVSGDEAVIILLQGWDGVNSAAVRCRTSRAIHRPGSMSATVQPAAGDAVCAYRR
jgi:hypothetical protein